jgi:HK97 family phage major capsid protein/HK97 family phage prohead protease
MTLNRAYSILHVKRVDDDARVIEGIATTPSPDRLGDVVEPMGAKFSTPMPLLWMHDSSKPVGQVTFAKATKQGIPFKARIERTSEPGTVKDRLDEAWQSVKLGLVKAVSIGFRSIGRPELMKEGGLRFTSWEWLELSLVSIPANSEATITSVKSIDRKLRAASGRTSEPAPGATGHKVQKQKDMKTIADQVAELEELIAPKRNRMKALDAAAADDGRELNESEAEEYDGLMDELKGLEVKLLRKKALETSAQTAKAVNGHDAHAASQARSSVPAVAKAPEEKGLGFARMVMAYAKAGGNWRDALDIAKGYFPNDRAVHTAIKSAVPGATSVDPAWAGNLVDPTNLVSDFVEFLRPMIILGKFGTGNIPALRRVPFNVRVPGQATGGTAGWIGEGAGVGVTKFDTNVLTLRWNKVGGIAVLSEDLLRFSTPAADVMVRQSLAEVLQATLDSDFINQGNSGTTDVKPAGINNGSTNSASSGAAAADVRADIKTAVSYFITNNVPTTGLVIVMKSAQALALSLMRNALGQREFPDITVNGGMLEGFPVICSEFCQTGVVTFISADNCYLADDGGVAIDLSREATIQMDTTPTQTISAGTSPWAPTAASGVSMFQTHSVAIRALRVITWKRRRSTACYYLTACGWGGPESPVVPI